MQPTLCARCHKNMAVVFINRIENGQSHQEGLCLKCARELHIKPIDDIISKMGINDEELDGLSTEMMEAMQNLSGNGDDLMNIENDDDSSDDDGKTATFPFLNRLFGAQNAANAENNRDSAETERPRGGKDGGERKSKRKFLDNYCISLTDRARAGKLDRMIGRSEELERVIQILNRRQKNNPCLIGEPGVGKTAIAEGLAQRIAAGDVPAKLRDKQVFLLDLTSLVAGTQFRGQFESRMKGLIEEIRREGNIILVIDEVHNLVGAGDAEGSMNAANILKPALSRGEIQVIGATTFTEYRKHIEKDAALERRFQPVTVAEPSLTDSVEILKGIRKYYEDFHGVKISDEMCRLAVTLSKRYITDRFLPDKAIDLIDEACSDLNLHDKNINRRMELRREIEDYDKERELLQGAEEPDFERLAELKSLTMKAQEELDALCAQGDPQLSMDNLARVIELWTKIPASRIREDEFHRLSELDKRLKEHIVGQDEAIEAVSAAIRRNRVGISPKHKPVSFIFVGPTGVGKTELVKQLAQDLFNSPDALIRLDMSEFMEKHSVSRIVGSPPGYVGYDEAGQLTEKIRRKPYAVILFDEIEKAHPDVFNILLQVLDDGRLTDGQGRVVDFTNTIIIMTSNLASREILEGSVKKEEILSVIESHFKPEFINRIDEIVIFNPLGKEQVSKIVELQLGILKSRIAKRGYTLTCDESVVAYISNVGFDPDFGARPIRRAIQNEIENTLAKEMLSGSLPTSKPIRLTVKDGAIAVTA